MELMKVGDVLTLIGDLAALPAAMQDDVTTKRAMDRLAAYPGLSFVLRVLLRCSFQRADADGPI